MNFESVAKATKHAASQVSDKASQVSDKASQAVKQANPLDKLTSGILAPIRYLSIIALVVYFVLFLMHCWRFKQTRNKHHAVMAFSLLLAVTGTILQLATRESKIIAISFPVNAAANFVALSLCAYLLGRWSRSMDGFSSAINRFAYPISILWSCAFAFGSASVVLAWVLIISLFNTHNIIVIIAKFAFFFPLFYVGHSILIAGTSTLLSYALAMFITCPRHNAPGVAIKRRQIVLLVVLFALLSGASLSMLFFVPYPSYCIMAVFYLAALFPQTALTGFDAEPCLVVASSEMASASARVASEPSHGRSTKKKPSPPSHLRVMHLPNADLASNGPLSCIAGIHRLSPATSPGELESVMINDEPERRRK
ncbi:hypothetical protein SYNPS1DRAFT_31853 [Syncephalis pseudoplumigaleata]|uniref:Uncharacterized protein n=1 Tax=Syncephalis pseudoplumigaleata TaxID=1712513 RepID=A0A4P9YS15_9FUNG|nr:hypothetical protein SYNPS1DRAFT_31853 [Syncephalis pseudoplumigaleata]|eukprot:RKP22544.1 hypothetical protein SYNPS1DRAFT_31853 [Syncephalis pseudoplumigaleata]